VKLLLEAGGRHPDSLGHIIVNDYLEATKNSTFLFFYIIIDLFRIINTHNINEIDLILD